MSRMISNKGIVSFLFPHRTHVLNICENRLSDAILINIQNIGMFLKVLHTFVHVLT